MGMVMSLTRLKPDELAELRERGEEDLDGALEFLEKISAEDDAEDDAEVDVDADVDYDPAGRSLDLDKSWDGISYLLAAADADTVGDWHNYDFLAMDDGGWVNVWTPEQVAEAADELGGISVEQLLSHFDGPAMTARDVYPSAIWAEDDDAADYAGSFYGYLVHFLTRAKAEGAAVAITFSS